ncbi:MAG: ParB-like nuclease domain-containing protein [Clostridia bacterium]|nr:ParB-like nuclease domain-containing protein [Clostridia bacterium]
MRAGIVAVKLPIDAIQAEETNEDVTDLAESIRRRGLLQPVGVRREGGAYRLVFGRRRLQACRLIGQAYIHTVLLSHSPAEETAVRAEENLRRTSVSLPALAQYVVESDVPLCLSAREKNDLMTFWRFGTQTRAAYREEERSLLALSRGDEAYFQRLCRAAREVPERASATVKLSLLSDRRIFLNEIERILTLMRTGGYADCIEETADTIVIYKTRRSVGSAARQ